MKPRCLTTVLLILLGMSTMGFAAGTPAGTAITTYVVGDYKDANGNSLPRVTSNIVTIIISQVAGVDVGPTSSSKGLSANAFVTYSVNVTNTGNGNDSFALLPSTSGAESGEFTLELYHDVNVNGVIDAGESLVTNTGVMAADATYYLILKITDATGGVGAPDGDVIITSVLATSAFNGSVSDSGSSTTTVTAAILDITIMADPFFPQPGDVITYWMIVTNSGSETAHNTVITAPIPPNTTYIPSSIRVGTIPGDYSGATPNTDAADGDASDFNVTTFGAITAALGDLSSGVTAVLFGKAVVNAGVPAGTNISNISYVNFENAIGVPYPEIVVGGGGGAATVAQLYVIVLGASASTIADPGDQIRFSFSAKNAGNGPDLINLAYTSTFLDWTLYRDFDGDGLIDAEDNILIDTDGDGKVDLGTLAANQLVYVIAKSIVQVGSGDGDVDNSLFTGYSGDDPVVPPASDTTSISTTITAPVLTIVKSVVPLGNQPPGALLTFNISALNAGSGIATDVIMTDAIPTHTTYVPNSMRLNNIVKTDVADGDQGTLVGNSVVFNLPSVGPGGAVSITFQVTVD